MKVKHVHKEMMALQLTHTDLGSISYVLISLHITFAVLLFVMVEHLSTGVIHLLYCEYMYHQYITSAYLHSECIFLSSYTNKATVCVMLCMHLSLALAFTFYRSLTQVLLRKDFNIHVSLSIYLSLITQIKRHHDSF